MLQVNTNLKFLELFNTDKSKPSSTHNTSTNVALFANNTTPPVGDSLAFSQKTIPPVTHTPHHIDNDTIPRVPEPDTLRFFKDPKDMVVIEFYSSGKPHYVKNFYDNVITKKTEYTSDGIIVTEDEYINGILRKHTDNYPGTGEPWIIEEYNEKGEKVRLYEYAPFYQLIDYKAFPVEE